MPARLPSSSHHDGCALLAGTPPCTTAGDDPSRDDGDGVGAGGGVEVGEEVGVEEGSEEAAAADRSVSTGQLLFSTVIY